LVPSARLLLSLCLIAATAAACERTPPAPVATTSAPQPAAQANPFAPAAEQFAAVQAASNGSPRVYGSYTKGCVAGAKQLPLDAPHWQVLNPSRNRAWGHPALVRFVERLADGVAADGWRGLLIGDLAQPRGGPLPSDHNSHQVGLDADIWLTPLPLRRVASAEIETFEPPTMVDFDKLKVNPNRFGAAQYAMLKRAALAPEVERIFVSPPIKRALCQRTPAGERSWLRKVRPWRGHTSHMHVRLACPADSVGCEVQDPPPEGDGCGAELQSWFTDRAWTREGSAPYKPETALKLEAMPPECRQLLVERG
jgi:penicillin-insensitive murein DD-endopeptidase